MSDFQISVIGLGLMGGSLAFALRGFRDCRITGYDLDASVAAAALERGAIDRAAASPREAADGASLTLFCSSPHTIIENMRMCIPIFKKGSVVSDICGIKRDIFAFAERHMPPHADYVGTHPMAGKEVGGFVNADPRIFAGAGFILTPSERCRPESAELLREAALYAGAGRVVINRAGEHDRLIAYTSDLMHISAAALCADFPPDMTMAHTAGAFRDCTRIADIDAELWTELLTENADNIKPFLDAYISALTDVKSALARDDRVFLNSFLSRAARNKRRIKTL
ncbi:MAG: prephenate dehydrogenase/arogenate dehydrogenase family protein [Oscillospiraceae bacterium]|nr:prephenate dehydrogenase/arogenate dehydrogenase family protein [Oscillospiraceae bacterium]